MAQEDFCFTFYDGDAARDVAHMNRLERGAYWDLMISQRRFGRMSIDRIKKTLGKDFEAVWDSLSLVLIKDDKELFYIEWVDNSLNRRKKDPVKALNGSKGGRPTKEAGLYKKRIKDILSEIDLDEEIDRVEKLKIQASALEDEKTEKTYTQCLEFLYDLKTTQNNLEKAKQKAGKKANGKQNESKTKASNGNGDGDIEIKEFIEKGGAGGKRLFERHEVQDLPQKWIEHLQRIISVTKRRDLKDDEILTLYDAFLARNLESEPYKDTNDVHRHFINWAKKQDFKILNDGKSHFPNSRGHQKQQQYDAVNDLISQTADDIAKAYPRTG